MKKSPALLLVALVLIAGVFAALWFTMKKPTGALAADQAGTVAVQDADEPDAGEDDGKGAQEPLLAKPRGAGVELAGASELAAGERSVARATEEIDPDTARHVAGRIVFPAGMARDDTLSVIAIGYPWPVEDAKVQGRSDARVFEMDGETGRPQHVPGKELPANAADARESKIADEQSRVTATVGADGRFELLLPERCLGAHIYVDGRHLYLAQPVGVVLADGSAEVTLEPLLGARVLGRASVPSRPQEEAELAGMQITLMAASDDDEDFDFMPFGGASRRLVLADDLRFEFRGVEPSKGAVLATEPEAFPPLLRSKIELRAGEDTQVVLEHDLGARVAGRVVDGAGEPIEGVDVARASGGFGFGMMMGGGGRSAKTDTDGRFALRGMRPGKTVVKAEKTGYVAATSDERTLVEGETLDGVVLVLDSGLALRGRVTWPDGTPAAKARVNLTSRSVDERQPWKRGSFTERTDDDGRFAIAGLLDEALDVDASAARPNPNALEEENAMVPELEPVRASGGPRAEMLERLKESKDRHKEPQWTVRVEDVRPGGADLLLVLEEPHTIAGQVVDETGAPLDAFSVESEPVRGDATWWTTSTKAEQEFTDAGGRFELGGLQPGRYRLTPKADAHAVQEDPREIDVPYSGEPLVLVLPRSARVTGVVLDPAGVPVAGADVSSGEGGGHMGFGRGRRPNGLARSTETDEEGRFELDLPATETSLTANADGWAQSAPLPLELVPAGELENVVLQLTLGGTLTGEVYRSDGAPQEGAKVMANSMGGANNATGRAGDAGRFTIEHLTPGTYQVMVQPELDAMASMMEGGDDADFSKVFEALKMSSAEIVEGETAHVVLGAPPKAPVKLTGRVTDAGEPVAGRMIVAMAEGQAMMSGMKMAQTDADGRFALELREPGPVMLTLQLGTSNSNPQWFEDVPEVEQWSVELALATGRLGGTVLGPDGRPLSGVGVRLERAGGEAFTVLSFNSRVTTDADGRFSFVNVDAGDYALRAGGAGVFGGAAAYGTALVTGIRLGEGERREDVAIRLDAAGEIRGRVVDTSGRAATNAAIFVRDAAGRLVDSFTATQTDAAGRFTYRGIAPGDYTVSARSTTEACADSGRITVRGGEASQVELALEPATMVLVTIESAEGVASRARVRVIDDEGREYAAMTTPAAMEAAFTQGVSTRQHRIGPVPPGRYTVIATTFDGVEKKKPVTLRGQEERHVRLDLE